MVSDIVQVCSQFLFDEDAPLAYPIDLRDSYLQTTPRQLEIEFAFYAIIHEYSMRPQHGVK